MPRLGQIRHIRPLQSGKDSLDYGDPLTACKEHAIGIERGDVLQIDDIGTVGGEKTGIARQPLHQGGERV